MTFLELAKHNVLRNFRSYLAYFLSATFSVFIFFLFLVNLFHPEIDTRFSSGIVRTVMTAGEIGIFGFSILFILYSVGTFLQNRSQEFGLLTILGITRGQLNRLIFLENMLIGSLAVVVGAGLGLLVAKYFLQFTSAMLETSVLSFYFPVQALLWTVLSFLALFVFISFLAPLSLRSKQVVELLKGAKKPKPEPKASLGLSVLAFLLLATAYAFAFFQVAFASVYLIGALIAVGTYFFYTQLSVYVLKALKRQPRFYFRKINLLWVSDLVYRVKDNARLLFVFTLTLAVAFTAMAASFALSETIDEEFRQSFPLAFSYISAPENPSEAENVRFIGQKLQAEGAAIQSISIPVLYVEPPSRGIRARIVAVSNADFNRMATLLKREKLALAANEAAPVSTYVKKETSRITAEDKTVKLGEETLTVTTVVDANIFPEGTYSRIYVTSDEAFRRLSERFQTGRYYGWDVPEWETKQAADLAAAITDNLPRGGPDAKFSFRASSYWYQVDKLVYKLIFFVGAFISLVFFVASSSFIYFRFYTDVAQERIKFQGLRKIGLSVADLKKTVTIELALLFFIPYIAATVHSIFALQILQSRWGASLFNYYLLVLAGFFVAQAVYFWILRSRYIHAVLTLSRA